MVAFIEGLDRVGDSGGNVFAVLDELGLSEIRVRNALLSLAGNTDLVTNSLNLAQTAIKENTALNDEFSNATDRTAAQMALLRNQVTAVAITIGDAFLPLINEIVAALLPVIQNIARWTEQHPELARNILIVGGVLAGLSLALIGIGVILPALTTGFAALGVAIHLALGPLGLVILAISVFVTAYTTNLLGFRDFVNKILNFIAEHWLDFILLFAPGGIFLVAWRNNLFGFADIVNTVGHAITGTLETIIDGVIKAVNFVANGLNSVFGTSIGQIGELDGAITQAFDKMLVGLGNALDKIESKGKSIGKGIGDIFTVKPDESAPAGEGGGIPPTDDQAAKAIGNIEAVARSTDDFADRVRGLMTRQKILFEDYQRAQEVAKLKTAELVGQLDTLGAALVEALRKRNADLEREALRSLDSQLDSIKKANDISIDLINEAKDAQLQAISERLRAELSALRQVADAQTAGLNAEIDAIEQRRRAREAARDAERDSRRKAELEENLAEAQQTESELKAGFAETGAGRFVDTSILDEATEARIDAEQALADFEGDIQEERLRATEDAQKAQLESQIRGVQDTLRQQQDAATAGAEQARLAAQEEAGVELAKQEAIFAIQQTWLKNRADGIKAHFEELNTAEALQHEASKLIINQQQQEIIDLLAAYNPQWQNVGTSFGQRLVAGLESTRGALQATVNSLLSLAGSVSAAALPGFADGGIVGRGGAGNGG